MNRTPLRRLANRILALPRRCHSGAPGFPICITVAGLLFLAGCATPQPPTLALQAAESAIANADRARVADSASPELTEARQELAAARAAVQQENMEQGQRLALQSRASAELASAKAENTRARAVNIEMQKSIDTLKLEMQRNAGARQ